MRGLIEASGVSCIPISKFTDQIREFNGRSGDTYVSSKLTEDITATMRVSGGMESSISSVKHKKSDGIYDMHGRKVVRKAKHGVYIEDGKKVLE